ncbi:MAG: methylated-DNA--[protein]-cysteine S-methyltransferase [Bacteroidales bacterium]|nr:methylated-DNA--[protein]-cysteine S-methyltransferase [Bacteroidales bacterium]
MDFATYKSLIGTIRIESTNTGISKLIFSEETKSPVSQNSVINNCIAQLASYFEGTLHAFDVPLDLAGTAFQQTVWRELQNIPFGKTISYLDLSKKLGDPKKIRAAANANGKNPVSIIVPCHRVIGSDGSLTGYAGGLWRKQWLLEHEQNITTPKLF